MPPAARVGDMHTCPMVEPGPVPHVGGPILPPGVPQVMIGFQPAATVTNMATCVGPPDTIVKGSMGVFINYLPAARIGDMTGHGGVIILGCFTVMIGETGSGGGGAGGAAAIAAGLVAAGLMNPDPADAPIDENASKYSEPGQGGSAASGPVTHGSGKGGSTTVTVNDANKTVTIKTKMEYCGPNASEDYAKAAKKQIEDTWSGTMKRNGQDYKVKVEVETSVSQKCTGRKDADQIIVNDSVGRMNQTLYGAGPGNQTSKAATDTARPRRIAHEYGHTLGLDDDYVDTPDGRSVPKDPNRKNDIMSETWPDSNGVLPHPDQQHYDEILKKHGF